MNKTKKVILIDASILAESNCLRKFYYKNQLGLVSHGPTDYKLEFGTAFHLGKKVYETSGGDTNLAISKAFEYYAKSEIQAQISATDYRQITTLGELLQKDFDMFPLNSDPAITLKDSTGAPVVEKSFCIPYLVTDTVEFLLVGVIDRIVKYDKYYAILDYKTTGLKEQTLYMKGFLLSLQMMIYTWAVSQLFPMFGPIGAFVEVAWINRISNISRSSIIFYTNEQYDEMHALINTFCRSIIQSFESGNFPPNFTCCKGFKLCEFFNLCCENKSLRNELIELDYAKRTYNPLTFGGAGTGD